MLITGAKAKIAKTWPVKHLFGAQYTDIDDISNESCSFTTDIRPQKGEVFNIVIRFPPKMSRVKQKIKVVDSCRDTKESHTNFHRKRYWIRCEFVEPTKNLHLKIKALNEFSSKNL